MTIIFPFYKLINYGREVIGMRKHIRFVGREAKVPVQNFGIKSCAYSHHGLLHRKIGAVASIPIE